MKAKNLNGKYPALMKLKMVNGLIKEGPNMKSNVILKIYLKMELILPI